MSGDQRDHLFINYATENADFARWLTLKLTAEGYRVWCDQFQLLGGESYPRDIDRAIRERTFRMLSLISRDSVNKANPLKERTLGVNISAEREIDFVIPLRVDDIPATELNFHIADLTYIDFSSGWAGGFRRLLQKLSSIDAPRPLSDGRNAVAQWYEADTLIARRPERVWSNLLPLTELPSTLYRVAAKGSAALAWPEDWPRVERGLATWVFEIPSFPTDTFSAMPLNWLEEAGEPELHPRQVVSNLLRQYLRVHARSRGLFLLDDGSLYFPRGLFDKDRLYYNNATGARRWVQVAGERVFRLGNDRRETDRYHLAFHLHPNLHGAAGTPVVKVTLGVYFTEPSGKPLSPRTAHQRRRRMCRSWYNAEWLKRLFAIAFHLADGEVAVNLACGSSARLILSGCPLALQAPFGIDERQLRKEPSDILLFLDQNDAGFGIA